MLAPTITAAAPAVVRRLPVASRLAQPEPTRPSPDQHASAAPRASRQRPRGLFAVMLEVSHNLRAEPCLARRHRPRWRSPFLAWAGVLAEHFVADDFTLNSLESDSLVRRHIV